MRSLRVRITNLRNKISEKLPNDNEIFGYAGISKRIILDSLDESYDLLAIIEPYSARFETIFAKRNIAYLIEEANEFLSDGIESRKASEKFNNFLHAIAQIRYTLIEARLSLDNNTIKLENEILMAKNNLDELITINQNINEEYKIIIDKKTEFDQIKVDSAVFKNDLLGIFKESLKNIEEIREFLDFVDESKEEVIKNRESINIWKTEVGGLSEEIRKKHQDFINLKQEIEILKQQNEKNFENLGKSKEILSEQLQTNAKHQQYIQDTIEDVSRAGMAGSFKKRKDELKVVQIIWGVLTILSISGLIFISFKFLQPLIDSQVYDLNHLFYKIPIFASAVWLGWFSAKQYGFTSRILEDYSYKYALSLAFEGYKKETMDVDTDMLKRLIELTILNISSSPVSNFDTKNNHGTPVNEAVASVSGIVGLKNNSEE